MPPKSPVPLANSNKKSDEARALDSYGIYRVENYDWCPETCPPAMKSIFELVYKTQLMPISQIATPPSEDGSRSDFDTKAGEDYDMLLKRRAEDISFMCNDPELVEHPELTWVRTMLERVFLVFDRRAEERLDNDRPYHHCLACRRHFRPGSRPIINYAQTSRARIDAPASRTEFELCENKDHFNIPNFVLFEQPRLGRKVPDAMFGLSTYNLKNKPWRDPERNDLVKNDRVQLFDKDAITENLAHFKLTELNKKNNTGFLTSPYPMFSFGLWEAKKATGDTHDKAFLQTAEKLRSLLQFQRLAFEKARLSEEPQCKDVCPLVWFFSSVGADWQLWGCFEETIPGREGYQYPMVLLWTGKITDKHKAFQLLYIIDIIRFWAEYTYKPIVCTCLRRLVELRQGKPPPPLKHTIWDSQIPINKANTPWLFYRRNADEATFNDELAASMSSPSEGYLSPPSKAQGPSIDQSGSPSRKPAKPKRSNGQAIEKSIPVIPASEEYNWLLDRSTCKNDHVVIRINRQGRKLQPLILFDDTKWQINNTQDSSCMDILEQEKLRYAPGVRTGFTCDERWSKYLWSCSPSTLDHIHEDTQFCAIIPLNREAYFKQPVKSEEQQLFEPIETLLHVGMFLADFEAAVKRWCHCEQLRNEYEPGMMIQCENARCHLQWYHKQCVDLDEDDDPQPWMCPDCCEIDEDELRQVEELVLDDEYDADLKASDQRVQSTRALLHVWGKHQWPSRPAILRAFEKVLYNLDIIESSRYKIRSKGIASALSAPRYWVLEKDDPKVVFRAGPRKRQIVDHEDSDSSDAIDDIGDTLHNLHV